MVLRAQTRVKVGVIETEIKVRLVSTSSRKENLHLGGGLLSQLCALFERSEVSAHFHVHICSLRFLVLKDICGEGVGIVGIRVSKNLIIPRKFLFFLVLKIGDKKINFTFCFSLIFISLIL